ncbi:cell division protein FtsL [Microbulbifer sp. OS29]|uniref:Cell division protein FtsL n=1 Tax=Microbulbifer okhotskensis TaxID=2926617 RepID=A0A9X2J6P5_9GAMM|nr:cell division protein FtsL [Microbulbifer okhotskensis]MCO1333691.1 cell division protein FtsL [Microbulbifer okhotskensis]
MSGKLLFGVGLMWVAVILSSLSVVYITQRSRELTAELGKTQKAHDELRYEQERLLLEKGAWSAYSRVEQVARKKLKMHAPSPSEQVLVVTD